MTPAEAATHYTNASADDGYVMWFVTLSDPANPSRAAAWAERPPIAAVSGYLAN